MVFLKDFFLKMLIYDKMLPAGKALIEWRGYCVTNQLLRSISNVKGVVKINGVCLRKETMGVFGMYLFNLTIYPVSQMNYIAYKTHQIKKTPKHVWHAHLRLHKICVVLAMLLVLVTVSQYMATVVLPGIPA